MHKSVQDIINMKKEKKKINIDNYLLEIYSLKLDSIIKFNSYNIIKKMQKSQQNTDVSFKEIIKLFEANPNNNLNQIRNQFIN